MEELTTGAQSPLESARAALLASVPTLSVSPELQERWAKAAVEDGRLRLPTFFVRCADMGYACLPTMLRRSYAEKNLSFEDLRYVYQTLGTQHSDGQRMIFTPEELGGMELDELLAVTEYSLENFLDIYRFMPSMQAQKAGELARIGAEAAEKGLAARKALAALERGTAEHEACLREISAQYFIERLTSSTEGGEEI